MNPSLLFFIPFLLLIAFSVWMLIDAAVHQTKDKLFWIVAILVTGPFASLPYAFRRSELTQRNVNVTTTPGQTVVAEVGPPPSTSTRVIRGIGTAIAVTAVLGGFLMVGFFVIIIVALSAGGGIGGGSSK